MRYTAVMTTVFFDWLESESFKSQVQTKGRISRIETNGYFGDFKKVREKVFELRWENGRRVYFAYIEEPKILLLLGGNKNGQSKDIFRAEKKLKEYTENEG